jgi:hypothetical protein
VKPRKVGIPRLNGANLPEVVARLIEIIDELQGAVGSPDQRAVRLGELLRARIAQVDPRGELLLQEAPAAGTGGAGGSVSITGQSGRIVVTAAGQSFVIDLATVSPTTAGLLRAITVDGFGRVVASRPVTVGPNMTLVEGAGGDSLVLDATITAGDYDLERTAAGPLSSRRAVTVTGDGRVAYPDRAVAADATRFLGILVTSASAADDPVTVRRRGAITEAGWSWTPGPVWVGDTGLLTQTVPSTGWVLQVGTAVNATTIDIEPEPPIL